MLQLHTKQWHVTHVENMINTLKEQNAHHDAVNSIKTLSDCRDRTESQRKVYAWLISALLSETEQRDVDKLSYEEANYGYYLLAAVYDCVTMVV